MRVTFDSGVDYHNWNHYFPGGGGGRGGGESEVHVTRGNFARNFSNKQ